MDTRAIVIVEDNEAIARLVQEVLNDIAGYSAITVNNGASAITVIAEAHADLVILDIDLPGMNGFEIYDRLRSDRKTATIPILFTSAAPHQEELARRGIKHSLQKPFNLDDLLALVNEIFSQPHPRLPFNASHGATPEQPLF